MASEPLQCPVCLDYYDDSLGYLRAAGICLICAMERVPLMAGETQLERRAKIALLRKAGEDFSGQDPTNEELLAYARAHGFQP